MENIDIDIDIDKDNLKNIDIDIDIDMAILENIDIDKGILQNIDIDEISYRLGFGISSTPNSNPVKEGVMRIISKLDILLANWMIEEKQTKGEGQSLAGAKGSHVVPKPPSNAPPLLFTFPARKEKPKSLLNIDM